MDDDEISNALVLSEANSGFAWTTCGNLDIASRVSLEQQAVNEGFTNAQRLRQKLLGFKRVGSAHAAELDLLCGKELSRWMKDLEELEKENRSPEILVGGAGVTGAGKTSLLNALLEYPELLLTSSTEAATATVCRIAWNHNDAPGHEFLAEITFRDRDAVKQELKEVLRARRIAIDEVTEIISKSRSKICALWSLDEGRMEDMDHTVESVLASNRNIVALLGTSFKLQSSDADTFAAEIKPYLDSTPTPEGVMAWPMIEEVRIYVKADVLKHGIVLVDLPGLSDAIEGRSAVAERYYQKLCVKAIVTPAIRAVDEKTGVKLMSDYQVLRMQLDGKYNMDSLCVVVSKSDDIQDCDAFCKNNQEANRDAQLRAAAVEFQSLSKTADKVRKDLRVAKKKLGSLKKKCADWKSKVGALNGTDSERARAAKYAQKRNHLVEKRTKQLAVTVNPVKEYAQLERSLASLEGRRKHRCIWIRNQYIKRRILADFARRQTEFARSAEHGKHAFDGTVEIFPICATAFTTLLKKKKAMDGFPSKVYTGIPKFRHWLGEAVLVYREDHLDSLLPGLRRLYDNMRCWSDNKNRGVAGFSRKDIESLLSGSHDKYLQEMVAALHTAADELKDMSPIQNIEEKLASNVSLAALAADRWVYKYPDDPNSVERMAWGTYQAILRRDGGPFQSSGHGRPYYDFPLALGTPFLEVLRDDWLDFFQVDLPRSKELLLREIADRAGPKLRDRLEKLAKTAVRQVSYQLRLLLRNLQARHGAGNGQASRRAGAATALDRKAQLQKDVEIVLLAWEREWRAPGCGRMTGVAPVSRSYDIPTEYVSDEDGESEESESGEEDWGENSEEESEIDSDSDA